MQARSRATPEGAMLEERLGLSGSVGGARVRRGGAGEELDCSGMVE